MLDNSSKNLNCSACLIRCQVMSREIHRINLSEHFCSGKISQIRGRDLTSLHLLIVRQEAVTKRGINFCKASSPLALLPSLTLKLKRSLEGCWYRRAVRFFLRHCD